MAHVSVIIPTYNRGEFLVEAVKSVLAQTFSDFELLVVDDDSTDDTERRLRPYLDRLRHIRIPHSGVSAARNRGLAETKADWVAFLDSDDLWLPEKLERQVQAVRSSPEIRLCYTDEIWVRDGVRVNPRLRHKKYSGWIFEHCLYLCIISPSAALIRRDLLKEMGGFDEAFPVCEDYDLWLRITARYPVLFLDDKLIIKRGGHKDQLSKSRWGIDRFRVLALKKILQAPDLNPEQRRAVLRVMRFKCRILSHGAGKRGRHEGARFYQSLARWTLEEEEDDQEMVENPSQ